MCLAVNKKNNEAMDFFRNSIEKSVFGVCSYLGSIMGISSAKVRMYFIYTSFVALGSPILIYLVLAFWVNIANYLRKGFDLVKN
jgi:phage shock protein C